jgi:hypothetical protein
MLIRRMASPSSGHGSLSFTTYRNKKPAANKKMTHSSDFLLSIHSLPRPLPGT